jgi:hypothetical protein
MDDNRFRAWLSAISDSPTRRAVASLLSTGLIGSALATLVLTDAEAKKKRKKKKKCAKTGQTPKNKKRCCRGLLKDAAGRCAPPCTPTSCATNSLCVDRVCQPCDVCQPAGACAFSDVQAAINADDLFPTTIRVCPGIYVGDLDIGRSLKLIGAGDGISDGADTILEGTGTRSVVIVNSEVGGTGVTFQRLRITGGWTQVSTGGGIDSNSPLTLIDCTVSGNTAGAGGGISSTAPLTLTNSVVAGNIASQGGGIYNAESTLTLDVLSRVSLNEADLTGGGGGIYNRQGTVTLSSWDNVRNNFPENCRGDPIPLCAG